jgi:large subunit ribosomal protein L10
MDREQKTAVVEELATELKDATAIFAVDYRGISVPQAAELRSGLLDADARFRIVKNRLTLRAADEAGTESLKEYLEGPTALAFVKGDAASAAKTIFRLGSEWELLDYKGGLMDGETLDPDSFVAIARLPGQRRGAEGGGDPARSRADRVTRGELGGAGAGGRGGGPGRGRRDHRG